MENSEVLNTVPTEAVAGTTIEWSMSLPHTPADGFDATITLANAAGDNVSVDAEASTDEKSYDFTLAPTDTENLPAGTYFYQVTTADGTDVFLEASGQIVVSTLIGDAAYDARSDAQKILDAIDATALNKATIDQQNYQIANRQLGRIPLPELLQLRKYYAAIVDQEIRKERLAAGRSMFPAIKFRF